MSQDQLSSTQVPRPRTVAIVTGASRGLGQAFAHQLATQCTHLITIARQAEADKSTAELAAQHGCELLHISSDLSDPAQWTGLAHTIRTWLNTLQSTDATLLPERYLLINNAGSLGPMAQYAGLAELGAESAAIAQTMNLNISAVIYLSSVFVQAAKQASDAHAASSSSTAASARIQVMNISSGAARNAYPGWAVYCASKAALDRYSEVLQVEAPFAQVVSIAPGVLDTAMQADIRQSTVEDFPNLQRFIDLHAEQGLSSPQEVAQQLLAYSLSPDFGHETLQDIRLITP